MYFVLSPHTWVKWTVSQACKRDKNLTALCRFEEAPLPPAHSYLLLCDAKGQTQESIL